MKANKKVLGYFLPLFVACLCAVLLSQREFGLAAGVVVVFMALVLGVDKIKISKTGVSIEDKDEDKN